MSETTKPVLPPSPSPLAPTSPMSRDTDTAARPGFRSTPNSGSKAQKAEPPKKAKKKR